MNQRPRDDIEDINDLLNKIVDVIEESDNEANVVFPALTRVVLSVCLTYDVPVSLFFEVVKEVDRRAKESLRTKIDCQKNEFSE
jgi:hypothetical protein